MKALVWKDVGIPQRDVARDLTAVYELEVGELVLAITQANHSPGQWVLYCTPFFDAYPLEVTTLADAQEKALWLVTERIEGIATQLNRLRLKQQRELIRPQSGRRSAPKRTVSKKSVSRG